MVPPQIYPQQRTQPGGFWGMGFALATVACMFSVELWKSKNDSGIKKLHNRAVFQSDCERLSKKENEFSTRVPAGLAKKQTVQMTFHAAA
jgi:hypothetical protein